MEALVPTTERRLQWLGTPAGRRRSHRRRLGHRSGRRRFAFHGECRTSALTYLIRRKSPASPPDAREVIQLITSEGRKASTIPGEHQGRGFLHLSSRQRSARAGGLAFSHKRRGVPLATPSPIFRRRKFDETFKTNVDAMFCITKAAMPHLTARVRHHQHGIGDRLAPGENISTTQPPGAIMIIHQGSAKQLERRASRQRCRGPPVLDRPSSHTAANPGKIRPSRGQSNGSSRATPDSRTVLRLAGIQTKAQSIATGSLWGRRWPRTVRSGVDFTPTRRYCHGAIRKEAQPMSRRQ